MQLCHMDHHFFGRILLPSFCICADLEDASKQDRKEDRKKPLDRRLVSEYQNRPRGMNHTQEILLYSVLESL